LKYSIKVDEFLTRLTIVIIGIISVVIFVFFLYIANTTYQSPYATSIISSQLEICEHVISEEDLKNCKDSLDFYLSSMCGFFDKPQICNDPRIDEIRKKQTTDLPNINLFEEVRNPESITLVTYKNNDFNFQIDYPVKWTVDERISPLKNIVGFKDKPSYPFVLFLIQENYNQDDSFEVFISKYKAELSEEYPVSIDYENQIVVNGIETYELKYRTMIDQTECYSKEYILNLGKFVPVFKHERCDLNHFEAYLPLFDIMMNTFKMTTIN